MTTMTDEQLAEWKLYERYLRSISTPLAVIELIAEVERLREALTKAAEQFEFYASEHRRRAQIALGNGLEAASQSSTEKALANERFADMCRASLPEKLEKPS